MSFATSDQVLMVAERAVGQAVSDLRADVGMQQEEIKGKWYVISDGWETPGTEMICRGRIVTSATIQQNGE